MCSFVGRPTSSELEKLLVTIKTTLLHMQTKGLYALKKAAHGFFSLKFYRIRRRKSKTSKKKRAAFLGVSRPLISVFFYFERSIILTGKGNNSDQTRQNSFILTVNSVTCRPYKVLWHILCVNYFMCCCVRALRLISSYGHTETGPRFKVSSARLVKPEIELMTPGLHSGWLNRCTTGAS